MSRAANLTSFEDRPFGCPSDAEPQPIVTVIDLPFPPSTNAIWRHGKGSKVYLAPAYKVWKQSADNFVLYTGAWRKAQKIRGSFYFGLILNQNERNRSGDLDNRIKAVLDWCQQRDLIRNDCYCEMIVAQWGVAPHGCRITLREVPV